MKNLPLDFLRFTPSAATPFLSHLSHFITLSLLGFGALKLTKTRTPSPNDLNIFFTSVSAATVSSMSVVEMEVFSNTQLIIITILMFLGSEIFVSAITFQLSRRFKKPHVNSTQPIASITHNLELESGSIDEISVSKSSLKLLGRVVITYLLGINLIGSCLILLYIVMVDQAKEVIQSKGINLVIFSIFSSVSTFSNCGFIPTNENMIVFKNNSGLLLILIGQVLLGGTLYPVGLRLAMAVASKATRKKEFKYIRKCGHPSQNQLVMRGVVHLSFKHYEISPPYQCGIFSTKYILKNYSEMGYNSHLLSGLRCGFLAATAAGFIVMQLILFCSSEWKNSGGIWEGMNPYQKFVGSVFQVVNSRHAGESVVDISGISPAILVVFILMMYLPPYTTFLPTRNKERGSMPNGKSKRQNLVEFLTLSQLSYLAIFIILICITEREKLRNDPLNFNVLNITIEVISAYGNVGFSTGYSCKRQLKPESNCKDAWYGFAGRWSGMGKFILILVMIFGRLKSFSMHGGTAWELS